MRQAASYLDGTHDFKKFCNSKPRPITIRTIYETSLEKEDDLIRFRITGNSFSIMVRLSPEHCLRLEGDYPPEKIKKSLRRKIENGGGATAECRRV